MLVVSNRVEAWLEMIEWLVATHFCMFSVRYVVTKPTKDQCDMCL